MAKFAASKGSKAATSWLFNLNPLAHDHLTGEMNFTGGGYTRSKARGAVRFEYDHAPLPVACEEPGCNGVAWYKGTFGAHKCTSCGTLALGAGHLYLDDLVAAAQ